MIFNEELIKKYNYLVRNRINIAMSKQNTKVVWRINEEDLYQEAMIAFANACENFDEGKGLKFSTYLTTCVDHRINDYLRRNIRSFSIPQKANALLANIYSLENEGLTVEEIAKTLEISEEKVEFLIGLNTCDYSLDYQTEDSDRDYHETIADTKEEDNEEDAYIIIQNALRNIKDVSEVDFELFCQAHGVGGYRTMSINELVLAHSEMSESTIRRHVKKAEQIIFPIIKEKYNEFYA